MPRELQFSPGFCSLRLSDIDELPSDQKTELISSIANDISAAFIYIARLAEAGSLTATHTMSMDNVIRTIKDTGVKHRRRLERKVARYRRAALRWRKEKIWHRRQLKGTASRIQTGVGAWNEQTREIETEAEDLQRRLKFVEEKYELLKAKVEIDNRYRKVREDDRIDLDVAQSRDMNGEV
jgi:hypothetical protein